MTKVLAETWMRETDENSIPPPSKRVCLSSSKRSHANQTFRNSKYFSQPMANSHDIGAVVNGYSLSDSLHHHSHHHHHHHARNSSSPDESSNSDNAPTNATTPAPVATLSNLGNTCFLNSVLYTLRFAPSFLHNLHHLVNDLAEIAQRHSSVKVKSSSLGRSIGNNKNWSKDLPFNSGDTKIANATERLHDLFESLHNSEFKDQTEPFQPEVFLQSLRDVNPIFEGNQQHDAHELLVCLIDNIRETCRQLTKYHETQQARELKVKDEPLTMNSLPVTAVASQRASKNKTSFRLKDLPKKTVQRFGRSKRNGKSNLGGDSFNCKNVLSEKQNLPPNDELGVGPVMNGDVVKSEQNFDSNDVADCGSCGTVPGTPPCSPDANSSYNFIADDFQGVSVQCTVCLECEQVTQRQETFCDICVPIKHEAKDQHEKVSQLYHSLIVMEEFLVESNKYWCEQCCRYNEAKRYVEYETLPRLLTLQLKRFSSGNSGVEKVNEYMPTPFTLDCFCKDCSCSVTDKRRSHHYQLYGVIMHLGATIASGHYVTYVRAFDNNMDYEHCQRDKRKTLSLSGGNLSNSAPPSIFSAPEKQTGLLRFFKRNNALAQNQSLNMNDGVKNHVSQFHSCRSLDCCGIRFRNDASFNGLHESLWLECDDDTIRTLSEKDFKEILEMKSSKNLASTPYLLFYVRISDSG